MRPVEAASLALLVLACFAGACSSSADEPAASQPTPPAAAATSTAPTEKTCKAFEAAGTDLTKPTVSFRTDVVPILQGSCGFTGCHGAGRSPVVGTKASPLDPKVLREGMVGKAAVALPTMSYVTARDTSKSFLMHKMDGDQCLFDKECKEGSCGDSMPHRAEPLPIAERDVIRRWIAQGAADD